MIIKPGFISTARSWFVIVVMENVPANICYIVDAIPTRMAARITAKTFDVDPTGESDDGPDVEHADLASRLLV